MGTGPRVAPPGTEPLRPGHVICAGARGGWRMADTPVTNARWLRIKALFAAALEQSAGELGAWLDANCGEDAQLRRELKSLVASHHRAAGFMEAPAMAGRGAARVVADSVGPIVQEAMIGRRLGPYRLVSE